MSMWTNAVRSDDTELNLREEERRRLEERERRWKDGETAEWTNDQIEKLFSALGGKGVAGRILTGNVKIATEEVIKVDRSVRPTYPDWLELLHPELETVGPAEYPISQVGLWLHDYQKLWHGASGEMIHDQLRREHLLETCLGLSDLEAIQSTSLVFFQEHFQGKHVIAWKSVGRHRGWSGAGCPEVPLLCVQKEEVVIIWEPIDQQFMGWAPCLLFHPR